MESTAHRQKVQLLAEDFSWLEEHCRKNPELAIHAAHLRLASALTRNVIGPSVNGQGVKPLHLAVVGGAGAGKSTVVNFLAGRVVADANPQAGFTRHPTAFVPSGMTATWPSELGFLGPLVRLAADQPADLDQDVYQMRRLPAGTDDDALVDFAIWDCPDMTTWASSHYVSRLMEVVAVADVIVYVASDERYNDEVPTQFLHLLIQAGKPVICCLTKMRDADADAIVNHFRQEVLAKLHSTIGTMPDLPVLTIPNCPADVRKDPSGAGARFRIPLLNAVLALVPDARVARQRTVEHAVMYLQRAGDGLLNVARRDLTELESWRGVVNAGRIEFEQRYRTEYLAGEAFRHFDKTREQVLHMLNWPGPGQAISAIFALIRKPYEYARTFISNTITRPTPPQLDEHVVCSAAMEAWLHGLQAEAIRRSALHPLWKTITHGFDANLKSQATDHFTLLLRSLETRESSELDAMARAVPEALARNPVPLNLLRAGVLLLDVAVIALIVWRTWPPGWWLLLIIPAVSITRHLVEVIVKIVVDAGRNKLKSQREGLVSQQLTLPLAQWLGDWPTTAGTSLERLQLVLQRVPDFISELGRLITPKAGDPVSS